MASPTPTGRQHDVVYLPAHGHQVVLGTAGSGKTVMAIHRAAHLARKTTINSGPTLLVTYTKSLTSYLTHIAAGFAGGVDIRTYHHFSRGYLASQGLFDGFNIVADGERRRYYLRCAIQECRGASTSDFFDKPVDFFLDELDWIWGHGLRNLEEYLAAQRIGRSEPLSPARRRAMWKIRELYQELRAEGHQRFDWWELPTAVRDALAADGHARKYRHVVVDEAQDFPPEAIRSLVDVVQPGGSVTLFADYAQQVYGHRTSYSSCNLNIKRVELFSENYRNTREIARLAIEMSNMPHFSDSADLVVPSAPAVAGQKPTLFRASNAATELSVVHSRAAELGKTEKVAVLAATWDQARRAVGNIRNAHMLRDSSNWIDSPGVYVGTYHSAKGLEFDAVILPFCSSKSIPDSDSCTAFGKEDALTRAARLLYVGVTRAKSELLVTYTDDLTQIFPAPSSDLWLTAGASS